MGENSRAQKVNLVKSNKAEIPEYKIATETTLRPQKIPYYCTIQESLWKSAPGTATAATAATATTT